MRGYDREKYEEEESRPPPTQEEVEFLELRQRLKDSIRLKRKHGAAAEKKLPYTNFGSFFGPSQPIIAHRVIQESKSLLENQNLLSKMFSSNQSSSKNNSPKLGQQRQPPKPVNVLRKKVEQLKNARDYSFLSDDTAVVPAPAKEPGRPLTASNGTGSGRPAGLKSVTSKMPATKMEKKISAATARNLQPSAHRAPPSRVHSSDTRQHKPQGNKPTVKQVSSQSHMTSNVQRPKKKQLSEDEKALTMIRNMFHTKRYPVCDDDDVSDMEANWDEIMEEEQISAKIARKEDEEQLRLIEEEERRERKRKAKKRKLSQH